MAPGASSARRATTSSASCRRLMSRASERVYTDWWPVFRCSSTARGVRPRRSEPHHESSVRAALQQRLVRVGQAVEIDLRGNRTQAVRLHVTGETAPHVESNIPRTRDGIDAENADAAKDERHDGGVDVDASGQPRAGDAS